MSIRKIYQVEALFVGPTPASGAHFSSGNSGTNLLNQIHRVQTANDSLSITRQDVNQFGQLAAIDRVILENPSVTLDFSYLVTNAGNEANLGLVVDGSASAISGLMNGVSDEKNYFILSVPEGNDAIGYAGSSSTPGVIGFGNGFITSYSTEGSVGNFPRATVNVQAFNYKVDIGSENNDSPAVNPVNGLAITGYLYSVPAAVSGVSGQSSVIKPGDITVDISGTIGYSLSDLKIQSYNFSVNLNRQPIQKLGSVFPFARVIQFPINATLQVQAQVGDFQEGNLADVLCNDQEQNLKVTLRKPACSGFGAVAVVYELRGAKLDSQQTSASIGPNNTITLNYTAPIGGPNDVVHNFFISGTRN